MKSIIVISIRVCWIVAIVLRLPVLSSANTISEKYTEAEQHFNKANDLLKRMDYEAAIAEYSKVVTISSDSEIAQDAQYWIGQSYFRAGQFEAALSAFQKILDAYPASKAIPSTKLMMKQVQEAKKAQPLFEAVKKRDIEQVKLLVAQGINVNSTDAWERTPLHYAAEADKLEITQLLIKEEADLNCKDKNSETPMTMARKNWNRDVVKLLVSEGASADLDTLAYLGDLARVKNFVQSDSDVNQGQLNWALRAALNEAHIDVAEFLLERGADINLRDGNEATILHSWGWGGDPADAARVIKFAISHGADVNALQGESRWTPLHSACYQGRGSVAEVFIDNGADVNAKDKHSHTPLYFAVRKKDIDTVKLLIAKGANVNVKEEKKGGASPLHAAIERRHPDMAKLLIAKGADLNARNNEGETPLFIASAHRDLVELLLAKGADINARDNLGQTVLHAMIEKGPLEIAELLIAKGADINAKDKKGHTPLYIAVHRDYEVAELLLRKGADGNIRTESGQTLLQLAQERKSMESRVPDKIFDGDPNSMFGPRIACGDVDGDGYDDIVIGAVKYDNYKGRVYLFYGGQDMDTTPDLIFEGEQEKDNFGTICCGDIDNDGYEDILVVAFSYGGDQGRAYLYWGSERNSMDAIPDKIFDGESEKGAWFGLSHPGPSIYDIDNDGYRDIIFGTFRYAGWTGRAYLYYGNTKELMDTSHDLVFTGENRNDRFGISIGCGDVDNDGYGDIIIGARTYPGGKPNQGRAYLYYGDSKLNMDAKADEIFDTESKDRYWFGQEIICQDLNNDGHDDVVIGAQAYNNYQGRAYLFYGNTRANLDIESDMTFDGEIEDSSYGFAIGCGDIDGDHKNDIVIGASRYRKRLGRVYVYWGSEFSGLSPKPGRILTGENAKDVFSVGLACGDVNNDGFDDLVIGAPGYKAGSEQGRVYLYYGGPRNR
jgi:ankyrin repeat protein